MNRQHREDAYPLIPAAESPDSPPVMADPRAKPEDRWGLPPGA
jgi:hypothetical protein